MNELSDVLRHASADVQALNADKLGIVTSVTPEQQGSHLEQKFARLWAEIDGPPLISEYKFHDERKWRLDYAHLLTYTAIEIEGGIWAQGRHTRGSGFQDDCIKYGEAAFLGWTVFRLTDSLITMQYLERIKGKIIQEMDA